MADVKEGLSGTMSRAVRHLAVVKLLEGAGSS